MLKAAASPEDRRNPRKIYNKITFAELGKRITNVDWYLFVQRLYSRINSDIEIKEGDEVVVWDMSYLEALSSILSNYKGNQTVIANYLGWRALQLNGYLTTEQFRKNEFEFDKVKLGIQQPVELWHRCIDFMSAQVPTLVGRSYINRWFTEEDVRVAEDIVTFVRGAMEEILRNKEWLDEPTKALALEKLAAFTANVGYPEWVRNDGELFKAFNFVSRFAYILELF